MKHILSTITRYSNTCLWKLVILFSVFSGCKKADNFYQLLDALPQINNNASYAYKKTYAVGETMIITGHINPDDNLEITIGGQRAEILKADTLRYDPTNSFLAHQISIAITEDMVGKAREVKITTNGGSVLGAAIDVYSQGGTGSFSGFLTNELLTTFTSNRNIFLYCINGKGDVYYFGDNDKKLHHISKDGTETTLYDLSSPVFTGGTTLTGLLAGGVTPDGNMVYISASTVGGYVFCKLDLQAQSFTILNQSATLAAPFEGTASSVNLIVSAIYPDNNGNVYLGVGSLSPTLYNAIAHYNSVYNRINYLFNFKSISNQGVSGMPGIILNSGGSYPRELRIHADEGLLYAIYNSSSDVNGNETIGVFDLGSRTRIYSLSTVASQASLVNSTGLQVVSSFSNLAITLSGDLNNSYGYMPLPGKRLQVLLYQTFSANWQLNGNAADYDFPRWVAFDFTEERTYAYAPGRFRKGSYAFRSVSASLKDELLNYDEQGNLYTTANGRTALIKTIQL